MPPTKRTTAEAMLEAPWAILPTTLGRIVDRVRQGPAIQVDGAAIVALDGPHGGAVRVGSVSVLPVYGVIEHRADWMMEYFGGVGVDDLRESLRAELNDPAVKAVVLDVDSPGGTVAGVTELAAELRGARGGTKPIVAVANTLAASAAYWLASQADEVVVTPSGSVGSIGIYALHQDVSRMLDEIGVTMTFVSAGEHKTEGNEFEPLSDEARADIQSRVDASYAQFIADVAAGRRVSADRVEADYGGGRVLTAKAALAVGMVDRVETLAQTVQRLNAPAGRRRAMAAEGLAPDLEASAIGRHTTATDDGPWDGPANEARLPSGDGAEPALRKAHAWVDDDGDPEAKASYKFIHHEVSEDGSVGAANLKACSSGIGILNGGRGGTTVPEADRKGVHRHLAGHLTDADMEAPPYTGQAPFTERIAALVVEATELADHAAERARLRAKESRPAFSTATERSLRTIRGAIDELLAPDDPEPSASATAEPVEPAPAGPSTSPVAAPIPRRFQTREAWLRHLEKH